MIENRRKAGSRLLQLSDAYKWFCIVFISVFVVFFQTLRIHADVHPYTMGSAAMYESESLMQEKAKTLFAGSDSVPDNFWNRFQGVCYNGDGKAIPGAVTRGIDVSEWQGTINWYLVKKSDVDFAFIRCGYTYESSSGTYSFGLDYKFYENMANANAVDLPVGVYIYSKAKNESQARADARKIVQMVQGYKISYPLVLDMEEQWQIDLGKSKVTSIMKAFCDEVRKYGYYPMIYTNLNWYQNAFYPDQLSNYDLWVAAYHDKSTGLPSYCRHSIWQCTSGETSIGMLDNTGVIKGIAGNVDMNIGYVDYTKIIVPRVASTETPVNTVKNGWLIENGEKFYYVNNERVTGVKVIDGAYYFFKTAADSVSDKGAMVHDQVIKYGNYYYYLQSDGKRLEKGWVKYNNNYYYFRNARALKGVVLSGGKMYYFNSLGQAKVSGWLKWNNQYYYFKNRTAMKGAYGNYYFHNTKFYAMKNYKAVVNGYIYYYGSDFKMFKGGWKKLKVGTMVGTYFFDKKNGRARQGWQTIDGKLYYFVKGTGKYAGIRYENKNVTVGTKTYSFNSSGVCYTK